MRRTRRAILGVGAVATAVLAGGGMASAGHTNAVLETTLKGRNEVSADSGRWHHRNVGDRNGRGDAYVFGIDGDSTTLCYVLTVKRIKPATMAHIHKGKRGENGPVVVNLAAPADGNAADCLTEGEEGKFVDGQTVSDILEHPDEYYINVHNEQYPSGAIRGQLSYQR